MKVCVSTACLPRLISKFDVILNADKNCSYHHTCYQSMRVVAWLCSWLRTSALGSILPQGEQANFGFSFPPGMAVAKEEIKSRATNSGWSSSRWDHTHRAWKMSKKYLQLLYFAFEENPDKFTKLANHQLNYINNRIYQLFHLPSLCKSM